MGRIHDLKYAPNINFDKFILSVNMSFDFNS